jgi:hypothetical protein
MAFHMTLGEAKEALTRAKSAMGRVREKAEEAIGSGIEVAEVGGTAFGFGYANGRWGGDGGEVKVFGVPVDLGVGIALTGVSMFGGFGKYGEHGINVGAGAIASYAYRSGHQLGSDAAQSSDSTNSSTTRASFAAPAARAAMPRGAAASHATAGEWDSHGQSYTVFEHQGA